MEPKTEQRIRYESEIAIVQKRFGTLEEMRQALGFSQRKMAELLMVDPSAWTRWTKGGDNSVPPYVYRALSWYMELLELRRASVASFQSITPVAVEPPARDNVESAALAKVKFESVKGEMRGEWQSQFEALREQYESQIAEMRARDQAELVEKINKSEKVTLGWKLFLLINTAAVIYMIFARFF
jgi:transcriptional regulator with XRE-family HTH domain